MIMNETGTVVRVKTMVDGGSRVEIDFPENIPLGNFDDVRKVPVVVRIVPELLYIKMTSDESPTEQDDLGGEESNG